MQESDELEIRVQVYNQADVEDTAELIVLFDGEEIRSETLSVLPQSYGLSVCKLSMRGKAGKHEISVNGETVELEVVEKAPTLLNGGFIMFGPPNDRDGCDPFRDDLKKMTDADWEKYVDEMHKMGADCIIITASAQYLCFMPSAGENSITFSMAFLSIPAVCSASFSGAWSKSSS